MLSIGGQGRHRKRNGKVRSKTSWVTIVQTMWQEVREKTDP